MRKIINKTFFIVCTIILSHSALFAAHEYALLKLDGAVNPVVSEHLVDSIKAANREELRFIVLQMDTPGGLVSSTRDIIKGIMSSDIPVIVYAFPKGAQAASAGGYIMLSAHVAVMAPGTEIGAMHPVSPMLNFMKKDKKGSPEGVMEKKVLNDMVAYARSLAQKRGRNVKWAERAVEKAISSTYKEALQQGVIDLVAEDMEDLLKKLHKRKITMDNKEVIVLNTEDVVAREYELNWKQRLLNYFADPQIIFLLFIIAAVGITLEVKNPGMVVPGTIGAISMFLFLMATQIIPINIIGLILIILGVVLLILELQIVSYGLLTIGGVLSFFMGAMLLFDSPLPGGHIPISSIVVAVLFILGFVFIVIRAVVDAHNNKVTTGKEGLIGEEGVALRDFTGKGKILIHAEIWKAESSEAIVKDDVVEVTEVDGMTLIVKKKSIAPNEDEQAE